MTLALAIVVLGLLVALIVVMVLREPPREPPRSQVEPSDLREILVEAPSPELSAPPPELIEALREGECVLFLGGGLGAFPKVPSRRQLLMALVKSNLDLFSVEMRESLGRELAQGDSELVAELLATRVPPPELGSELMRLTLHSEEGPKDRRLVSLLSELPFSGVTTDIWSDFPEWVFADREPTVVMPRGDDESSLGRLLRGEGFYIAHLWGSVEDDRSLSLSWQQYGEALRADREFERFVASLSTSRSLLFLGASVSTIERFFELSGRSSSNTLSEHFAVVPRDAATFALRERSLRERFGVTLIPAKGAVDTELLRFVEALHEKTARRSRFLPPPPRPPRIEAVRLENIGPFPSLDLSIGHGATVLLGDNGSGKSSVLRAIALAFSGEGPDVNKAAEGLLRAGQKSGRIEVRLDGEPHEVVLSRVGTGVSVEGHLSPVADGLWLGLGFPPLRGVSRGELEGPRGEPPPEPSAQDLIPLAANQVDDRLGDLQQWVVNMAVRAEDDDSIYGRESERMLMAFFEVVARLAPGVSFEFAGIDRESWRVMLITEDGRISLDQLSRGMTAVFSWVGVLLRRLFQVHGDEDPLTRHALVLVDEIDLHLHPAWQRRIVPLVSECFPNVQLIASTHSPLVVGSVPAASLVHLQRHGGEIVPEMLTEEFSGWRSDQILTSAAFDLPTTRDPGTERRMNEYRDLISREELTEDESDQLERLSADLRQRLPSRQETEVGREAAELVRGAIRQRLEEVPAERREAVFKEAELYFQQLQGGPEKP